MPCSTERCIELVNLQAQPPKVSPLVLSLHLVRASQALECKKEPKSLPKRMWERSNESFPRLCILWMEGWKHPGWIVSSFCPEGHTSRGQCSFPPGNYCDQCPFCIFFFSENNLLNDVINIVLELWLCPCAVCLHHCLCFFQWVILCCLKDKCAPPSPRSWVCLLAAGLSDTPVSKLLVLL